MRATLFSGLLSNFVRVNAVRRFVGRCSSGGISQTLILVSVASGLALFALPTISVLRGGSAQFQAPVSGYERANAHYRSVTKQQAYFGLQILLRTGTPSVRSASVSRAVSAVDALLAGQHGFERLTDVVPSGSVREERIVMAAFGSPAASVAAADRVRRVLFGPGRRRIAGWKAVVGGPDVAFHELEARTVGVAGHVELFAGIAVLALCLLVFGGWAALLPIAVGIAATLLAFAALRLLDLLGVAVSIYSLPAVMGLALGLGVDYSLLLVTRYRQELGQGTRPSVAVQRMLDSAGRTVMLSAAAIAGALASLLVFPLPFLSSIGLAAAVTALGAGVAARLLVPRLILLLGRRVETASSSRHSWGIAARQRVWNRLSEWVTDHPVRAGCMSLLVLAAAAMPLLGWRLVAPNAQLLPSSAQSRLVEDILAKKFGRTDPAGLVYTIYRPKRHTPSVQALAGEQARIVARQAEVLPPRYIGKGTWELNLLTRGEPDSLSNQQLVQRLQQASATSGAEIGGMAAFAVDQRAAITSRLPLALILIGLVTAIALWLLSGSLVIAIKGILMAILSVAAGIGILIASCGALEVADLVFLVTIAFALSTDYELFLVTRIREERDHGLPNQQAIAAGLAQTGWLITSAALLFCTATGAFALSTLTFAREFGVGAAATVAVDASIVRLLLVPALMTLLGECNWWSPSLLRRLHKRIGMHMCSPIDPADVSLARSAMSASALSSGCLAVKACERVRGL